MASFDAGFAYYGEIADAGRYDKALRTEIRDWHNARLSGSFDWLNRFLMRKRDGYFKLDKVNYGRALGPTWKLSDWRISGPSGGSRNNSRYIAPQMRGFPLTNLAPDAHVTVSGVLNNFYDGALTADTSTGAGKDEIWGQDSTGEWAVDQHEAEKWVELTWDSAQKIRQIILFDRERADQNVTGGALTFTHGDTMETLVVTALDAGGAPNVINFPQKTVTNVRFTINSFTGDKPGLAEFVVLGPSVHYQSATLATGAAVTGVANDEVRRVTDGVISRISLPAPAADPVLFEKFG